MEGQELKKPANIQFKKKTKFFNFGLWAVSFGIYVIGIPLILGIAYRLYWQHGDFSSNEYKFLFITQLILTTITYFCHYKASTCDPGIVKPWHFREDDKLYYVAGREKEGFKNHGQTEVKPIRKMTYSEFSECSLCHTIKVCKPSMHIFVHHCNKCNKCILNMDHHCGFTGSCVGIGSLRYFVVFLVSCMI